MYQIICIIASLIISTNTLAATNNNLNNYYKHSLGISYGTGKPQSLSGFRVNYRNTFINDAWFEFGLEASYAIWQVKYTSNKKLEVFSLAPVVRLNAFSLGQEIFFFEGSVGVGKRSTVKLANKKTGSKWTFQDIIGFGCTLLQQKVDFKIQYTHYSNAGLARPNPGTEVIPMLTLSYWFS